jgi:dUTP pyrophosphatase
MTNETEYLRVQLANAEDLLEKYANMYRNKTKTMKLVKKHPDAVLPVRAHSYDAGIDCVAVSREFIDRNGNPTEFINQAKQVKYGLGFAAEVPEGFVLLLFPRSSVCKTDLVLSNSVGVIDSGYQGEISAVYNIKDTINIDVNRIYDIGDRCCQLVLVPIATPSVYWGEFEEESTRGTGGYGSTGV